MIHLNVLCMEFLSQILKASEESFGALYNWRRDQTENRNYEFKVGGVLFQSSTLEKVCWFTHCKDFFLAHKINPSFEAMAINPVDVHINASYNIKLLLSHNSKISFTFLPFLPFISLPSLQLPSAISTILALPNHKPSKQRYFDNQQTSLLTLSFFATKK